MFLFMCKRGDFLGTSIVAVLLFIGGLPGEDGDREKLGKEGLA